MDFFTELVNQSLSRCRESTLSVLGVNDAGLRQHLSSQMNNQLGSEGCFLAPPVFEHTFGWQAASHTLSDLEGRLLSTELLNTLEKAPNYKFPRSLAPYKHQLKAWKHLLGSQPRSAVITTGTGSGKTECFMIPILEDLIRERAVTQKPLVGVRALFLYPLNALINSQQERLDAWTKSFDKDIRFCLYNGKTKETAASVRQQQKLKPNQQLSRESLRAEPAPILLTNATMLEYMLVRHVDNPILQISKDAKSLRWIVLDEAHTYIGSQAAELSLLLRRVVQAFGKEAKDIRFIATSATIAEEEAKEQLRDYLAGLAGVGREQVDVIGGSRVWPNIGTFEPDNCTLDTIKLIDQGNEISAERFRALERNEIATTLRNLVVRKGKPVDLDDLINAVVGKLVSKEKKEQQQEALSWLDLLTGTRRSQNEPPFLKLRVHLFQRMLHGLWSCVDPNCSSKTKNLKDWPFGNVYVTQRARCTCHAPVYELGFCKDCKTPHLVAEDRNGELHQCSPYAGDEFSLTYESSEDEPLGAPDSLLSSSPSAGQSVILAGAPIDIDLYDPVELDVDSLRLGSLTAERSVTVHRVDHKDSSCSACRASDKNSRDFLKKSYLGSPFYVANAVPTVLEFCPDPDKVACDGKSPEELPGRGRKLITFTDSRQGTARMAVRMQQEAERSKLRGLVFSILKNAQISTNQEPKNTPSLSYEQLMSKAVEMENLGMHKVALDFREEAELQRTGSPDRNNIAELGWHELVTALANSIDINTFILDYNNCANPVLFSDSTAGSRMAALLMAREYARRPKNQNSTETLGLVKVGYKGLENIQTVPEFWESTIAVPATGELNASKTPLTLKDWKDFLKVALDFYVRENTFIDLDAAMQNWMGSRFSPKKLFPSDRDIVGSASIKRWPDASSSQRLVKLLELATGFDRTTRLQADKLNLWLRQAWTDLADRTHILELVDRGRSLKLDKLTFSLPIEAWICPVTHRLIDTTFRGLTPYLPRSNYKGNDYRCKHTTIPDLTTLHADSSSVLEVTQVRRLVAGNDEIKLARQENLWTDISDRTVEGGFYYRTAEHSAQQSSEKLEKYEDLFKKGEINVLNCSTTMEMGVDIGGVSAVVMNNVPPHPANYLQRAGRAGRRSEARAISYTLCKANPHDQRAFANPKWPFLTAISAPGITLSSDRIVQRHVNSLLLSMYLRNYAQSEKERTKLNVKWFYGGSEDSVCNRFISWLESHPDEIELPVRRLLKGTGLIGRSMASICHDGLDILKGIQQKWLEEQRKLCQKISVDQDPAYKKALELELRRHEEEYLLKDLSSRAFLPGYGFPTNVVNLNTYNVEDFIHQRKKRVDASREDNIFTAKEQPSRGLDIAIREYAPGAQIVIDGRVYCSAGINLGFGPQKFDAAWRCSRCGATGVAENAYSNSNDLKCSHCNADIAISEQKKILRPAGFTTDFYEQTSNDISAQKFIRVERPRIQLTGELLNLPDSRCGFIKYGHEGSVFYHSSGEYEEGYAVCMSCGRADSMMLEGNMPRSLTENRLPYCGGSKLA